MYKCCTKHASRYPSTWIGKSFLFLNCAADRRFHSIRRVWLDSVNTFRTARSVIKWPIWLFKEGIYFDAERCDLNVMARHERHKLGLHPGTLAGGGEGERKGEEVLITGRNTPRPLTAELYFLPPSVSSSNSTASEKQTLRPSRPRANHSCCKLCVDYLHNRETCYPGFPAGHHVCVHPSPSRMVKFVVWVWPY